MGLKGTAIKLTTLAIALFLVLLAACAPAEQGVTPPPKPSLGEVTPAAPSPLPVTPTPNPQPTAGEWGIIEIRVTDPPPASVKSAVVYLTNIEVHKVSNKVSDNVGEWINIAGAPPSFDLMDIVGVEKLLASANVTVGSFTQIRMDVTRVEVVTVDGDKITAEVPSDKLKIVGSFNVEGGNKTILTLDFDGSKSLVITGKGKALFKPVIKLKIESQKLKG